MSYVLLAMIGFPLLGSIVNGLLLKPKSAMVAGTIATFCSGASFICALVLWRKFLGSESAISFVVPWISIGSINLNWGFSYDALTTVMSLFVTGIATLIHLYSIGYMAEDKSVGRFFTYLNLFLFNMCLLICGDSLTVMFVGWEGVGLCSYLLIGFWYEDLAKSNAGMKAFIVNRIGDAGFLLGIFVAFGLFGTTEFREMARQLATQSNFDLRFLSLLAFFLFVGAMGKSAQIPLYVWLPDAMAGPTPVSALIHAATMVTAGVYLVVRMGFLYQLTPDVNLFIAIIGSATALLSALIATSQNDIKKVLAYSTVSQLGLMFLALGARAYVAAIFHVFTHAFFKALLFLGSGSVIHGLHGEQDIRKMGGLKKEMPWTFLTFAVGTFAIAGIPPLAGFFSKDTILHSAMTAPYGMFFWGIGLLVSLLTAFYMARVFTLTFLGASRVDHHTHPHESGVMMLLPLFILALGSVAAGFLGVPHGLHFMPNIFEHFLEHTVPIFPIGETPVSEMAAMIVATAIAIIGTTVGILTYLKPRKESETKNPVIFLLENKLFIDEFYQIVFINPFQRISTFMAKIFDVYVVDGLVLAPGRIARGAGLMLSLIQQGVAQLYLLIMLLGVLAVFWFGLKGASW